MKRNAQTIQAKQAQSQTQGGLERAVSCSGPRSVLETLFYASPRVIKAPSIFYTNKPENALFSSVLPTVQTKTAFTVTENVIGPKIWHRISYVVAVLARQPLPKDLTMFHVSAGLEGHAPAVPSIQGGVSTYQD